MRFFKHFFAVLAVVVMTALVGMGSELSPELEAVKSACAADAAADATVQCACRRALGKTCNPDSGPTEVNWECNDGSIELQ